MLDLFGDLLRGKKVVALTGFLLAFLLFLVRQRSNAAQRRRDLRHNGSSSSSAKRKKIKERKKQEDPALPDFILLLGIPGSGKSTWAREYVFRCDASFAVVSSDDIRKKLTGSVHDQSRNDEVWETVLNHCQAQLSNGTNVILDGTNTNTEKRRKFVRQLPPCNKYIKIFQLNKVVAKNRITKAVENGEDRPLVPDSVIDKMFRQFNEALVHVKEENWLTR